MTHRQIKDHSSASKSSYDHSIDILQIFTPDIRRDSFRGYEQNGEWISQAIDIQEEKLKLLARECETRRPVISHDSFNAPDHPWKEFRDKYFREDDDGTYECGMSHSVGNTEREIPEFITLNLDEEYARELIIRYTAMWDVMGRQMLGNMAQDGDLILYPHLIQDPAALRAYDSEFGTLAATQLRLEQKGLTPEWVQIVYSDENMRMPWDPGYDKELYQPLIGMRMMRQQQGGSLLH